MLIQWGIHIGGYFYLVNTNVSIRLVDRVDQQYIDSGNLVVVMSDRREYPLENEDRCVHFGNLVPLFYSLSKYFLCSSPSNTNNPQRALMRMDVADDYLKSEITIEQSNNSKAKIKFKI